MDEMDEQVSLPPNTHNPVTGELVSDALKIARDKARAAFAKCGTVSNVLDMLCGTASTLNLKSDFDSQLAVVFSSLAHARIYNILLECGIDMALIDMPGPHGWAVLK